MAKDITVTSVDIVGVQCGDIYILYLKAVNGEELENEPRPYLDNLEPPFMDRANLQSAATWTWGQIHAAVAVLQNTGINVMVTWETIKEVKM